jgi:hypothetical protein
VALRLGKFFFLLANDSKASDLQRTFQKMLATLLLPNSPEPISFPLPLGVPLTQRALQLFPFLASSMRPTHISTTP